MSSAGTWRHLATRFFSVVLSSGLEPAEVEEIRQWTSPIEGGIFFAQPKYDQRHGLEAARHVSMRQPLRRDLIRAALLHDIGKRRAGLGPIERSFVSAYTKLGGVAKGRWRSYMEHGPNGSTELGDLGAEAVVVAFARHHHGSRPDSISEEDWNLLQAADGARRQPTRPSR